MRSFKINDRVIYLDTYELGTVDDLQYDEDGFYRADVLLDSGKFVCKMFHWFVKL